MTKRALGGAHQSIVEHRSAVNACSGAGTGCLYKNKTRPPGAPVTLPDIAPARGSRQVVGPLGEGLAPLPFDSLLTSFS